MQSLGTRCIIFYFAQLVVPYLDTHQVQNILLGSIGHVVAGHKVQNILLDSIGHMINRGQIQNISLGSIGHVVAGHQVQNVLPTSICLAVVDDQFMNKGFPALLYLNVLCDHLNSNFKLK